MVIGSLKLILHKGTLDVTMTSDFTYFFSAKNSAKTPRPVNISGTNIHTIFKGSPCEYDWYGHKLDVICSHSHNVISKITQSGSTVKIAKSIFQQNYFCLFLFMQISAGNNHFLSLDVISHHLHLSSRIQQWSVSTEGMYVKWGGKMSPRCYDPPWTIMTEATQIMTLSDMTWGGTVPCLVW